MMNDDTAADQNTKHAQRNVHEHKSLNPAEQSVRTPDQWNQQTACEFSE